MHGHRAIGIRLDDIRRDSDVLQPTNQPLGDRIVLADDHMTRDVTRDVLQSPHPMPRPFFQPGCVHKLNEEEGQDDDQHDHAGQEHY